MSDARFCNREHTRPSGGHGLTAIANDNGVRPYIVGLIAVLTCLVAAVAIPAHAADESIDELTVVRDDGRIYVSAALNPGLSSRIDEDLRKGLAKDLYYYLVLRRQQRGWFDEELGAVTVKYAVKYDLLKKEYVVTLRLPGGTTKTVVADFASAQRLVSRLDRVPIVEVSRLRPGKRYVVAVKAEMKAPQLPLYLDYFLFFIPFLEIDTEWRYSAVFGPSDGP